MGLPGHDHELPPADADAIERELSALRDLTRSASRLPPGATASERLEAVLLTSQLNAATRELESRPRYRNPAWYTGEAAFGLISLLLPDTLGTTEALQGRLAAVPRFLKQGEAWLTGKDVPADWVTRAKLEGTAFIRLVERGLRRHPLWDDRLAKPVGQASQAMRSFLANLPERTNADPAAGRDNLEFLMREVHQLPFSPEQAEELALEGMNQARNELVALAQQLDAGRGWQEQLAALALEHPTLDEVIPTYEQNHERAMAMAETAGLVTPAADYGLQVKSLPPWAQDVAGDLYFLFYRSPPARRPTKASTYWVFSPGNDLEAYLKSQSYSTIKITHAVHHGSIGHHTQNARARSAPGLLGRLAGTDCVAGIAMLPGGTMIEGWACYVQDLLLEADDFYESREKLLLKHAEFRNAAMCLADLRLHSGTWTLEQVRTFYRQEVGIPAHRAWAEVTRNSMYPSTRLMYWLGTQAIRSLRRELGGDARSFHDYLLSFGSVPVYRVAEELRLQKSLGV